MAYALDLVDSTDRLQQLHELDTIAYQEVGIDFLTFQQWWQTYDLGLRIALDGDRIVGAIGCWALDERTTRSFIGGALSEGKLLPMTHQQLCDERGSEFWYVSGVLIEAALRNCLNSPLRLLLSAGISGILSSGKVRYPANVYALGYSPEGIALLKRLGFEQIRSADEMIDSCPLYWKRLEGKQPLWR